MSAMLDAMPISSGDAEPEAAGPRTESADRLTGAARDAADPLLSCLALVATRLGQPVHLASLRAGLRTDELGRIPLDANQLARLGQLTGQDWTQQRSFGSNPGPEVSFDRPELSPILAGFADQNDPRYREALAIIQAGRDQLARRPRADMPGFVPSEPDQRREAKYALRRQIELDNREAIRQGKQLFDEGVAGR